METRKTAKKTTKKATTNLSKSQKTVAKTVAAASAVTLASSVKKTGKKGLIAFLVCLIIGIVMGVVAYQVVCKNDCFEILGGDEITLTLNDSYEELGVNIIEFNKDISDEVVIETNLELDANNKPEKLGTYYVKYSVDSLKYGKIFKVEKVRIVKIVEISGGQE